eukprot:TRINITY_DN10043_c0_g1_i17.p1 TRINITY_DN10043_c0_g1~~TRINITY_DN10043_c0_g1_i17.p1  ORF type:complete len:269 (+),score=65.37 TRINITY_DN10043_c0_g1_i17:993-1799(+)
MSLYNIYNVLILYNKNQERISEDIHSVLSLSESEKAESYIADKNERYKAQGDSERSPLRVTSYIKRRKQARETLKKYGLSKVFSLWDLVELAANIFQLTGSGLLLVGIPQTFIVSTTIGLGSFFSWLNILQYLRYSPRYYMLFRAIMKAFPTILKLMLGMILLFVGYAFLGAAVFWEANKFDGINRAMLTLFAVTNSDGIFFLYNEIVKINYWLAVVYIVSFIYLFIYLVQNLFLQVVYKIYASDAKDMNAIKPVSYTHLTLPTICSV